MANSKTKFFRVAVEGATVDGREIKREWLTQMAANYDPAVFGARLNVEHIKGYAPMSANAPFGAYGDVIALSAHEIDSGPLKGKLALHAQISPTEELVALSKKRQKIYTSIEVNPDFADTGEAYLVGLAATDDPASLGTEALQFAAKRSANIFSAACETTMAFDDEPDSPSLLSLVKGMFARSRSAGDQRYDDTRRAIEEIATFASRQGDEIVALNDALKTAQAESAHANERAAEAIDRIDQLVEQLANTDSSTVKRPHSSGSSGEVVTDC